MSGMVGYRVPRRATLIVCLTTTILLALSPALRDMDRGLPKTRDGATTAEAGGGNR